MEMMEMMRALPPNEERFQTFPYVSLLSFGARFDSVLV